MNKSSNSTQFLDKSFPVEDGDFKKATGTKNLCASSNQEAGGRCSRFKRQRRKDPVL